MMNRRRSAVLLLACFMVALCYPAKVWAQSVAVIIETRIKPPDAKQGMKSTQQLIVNFDNRTVSNDFYTGLTELIGIPLQSTRDKFKVTNVNFTTTPTTTTMSMLVVGETASGVVIMPNINYSLGVTIDMKAKKISLRGCHDGYPSYKVTINRSEVYHFQQENVLALFGSCDTRVDTTKNF